MELNVATLTVVYQGGEYQVEVIEPTDAIIAGHGRSRKPECTARCPPSGSA